MTPAGFQVQQNLPVPTCYPGIVHVQGETHPPSAKKWADVCLTTLDGKATPLVKIDWRLATSAMKRTIDVGKRWQVLDLARMRELSQDTPPRYLFALAGVGCSGARPMMSAKNAYNHVKALCGRAYRVQAPAAWGVGPMPGVWRFARGFVQELLPEFRAVAMLKKEWIASMPSNRKKPLEQALRRLELKGWTKAIERFSSFIKSEFLPGFAQGEYGIERLGEMLDRMIQGPSDESHVIAGPHLKPLIHRLKEVWTADNAIFYGSTGPEALHKWLTETLIPGSAQYIWCDFSMFDATHSNDSWEFMEYLYAEAGIDDPDFWRVMSAWRAPKGNMGPCKYQARVMNASGRDDTALANGVLNGFASYLSACAAWLDISLMSLTPELVRQCRGIIKLSVCGDDSLGRIPLVSEARMDKFRTDMAANIRLFGFEAKLCSSTQLGDAVYLGCRPYPVGEGANLQWYWGKTIGRATYKMGWVPLKEGRDIMAHITGVADMHSLCSSHVPVLSDLAQRILELRSGAKRTPQQLDPNKPWEWTYKSGVKYDETTIRYVAEIYSVHADPQYPKRCPRNQPHALVTPQDVHDLIAAIRSIEQLPCVLDHWLWRHMVNVDDL